MKKILLVSFLAFIFSFGYSQSTTVTANTIQAKQYMLFPLDTALAPKYIGEVRRRSQDTTLYIAVRLTGSPKWMKVLRYDQVYSIGNADTTTGEVLLTATGLNVNAIRLKAGTNITFTRTNDKILEISSTGGGGGISSLGGLTNSTQLFGTPGTSGTAPNWTTSGGNTHVLNIPAASASGVTLGGISKTDYDAFNGKFTLPALTSGSVIFSNGTTLSQNNSKLFWDNTNFRLGIGTTSPGADLHIYNASSAVGLTLESGGGGGFMQIRLRNGFGGDHWDITNYGNTNSNILAFINTGSEKMLLAPTYTEFKVPVKYSVITSSAATLSLTSNTASVYVFTGSTTTWTLPTVSGNTGREIIIKNRGSGNITLNSNAGGNDIYNTSAANTISVTPGSSLVLINDGTYYLVIN